MVGKTKKKSKIIILAGVPGSGKTSVAQLALEKLCNKGKEYEVSYEIVNFGDVLFEIMKRDGLDLKSKDEIRAKVDQDTYVEYQKKAAKEIAERGDNIILTTHLSLMTPSGFFPGLPFHILKELEPERIIIIEANPEEIRKRQEKDKTRIRGYDFEKDIALFQEFNRYYAVAYSALTGARLKIIHNPQGRILEAVEEFIKALTL